MNISLYSVNIIINLFDINSIYNSFIIVYTFFLCFRYIILGEYK